MGKLKSNTTYKFESHGRKDELKRFTSAFMWAEGTFGESVVITFQIVDHADPEYFGDKLKDLGLEVKEVKD